MHSMDRLSCLPDEVIRHILSFLPTQRSVQTCVLSKRWRFLWADVPTLEFTVRDTRTTNIITQLLLQHNHDIHTFRLYFDANIAGYFNGIEEFQSWIVNITTRNIHNLIISVAGDHFFLPEIPSMFTCKTLVELCLSGCDGIPVSGIYFPALKKLQLKYLLYNTSQEFRAHESLARIAHVLSGCPVLEELSIVGPMYHCSVSSPSLTRLVLRLFDNDEFLDSGVKLDTPILRYLQLHSSMSDKFLIGSLDSLIEADIRLNWDKEHQDHLVYSRKVFAFVDELHNVQVLKLSTGQIAEIHDSSFFGLANKFHNLTKLDLSLYSNLGFVTSFLENANNLQILRLRIHHWVVIDNQYYWMEPKQVPSCLISHLQTVEVYYLGCSVPEFEMIRYILMNGKAMKMMKIRTRLYKSDWKKISKAVRSLELFERGSQECQLVVD